MEQMTIDGATIAWSDTGEGEPTLLIHAGVFGAWFAPVAPHLPGRVIRMLQGGLRRRATAHGPHADRRARRPRRRPARRAGHRPGHRRRPLVGHARRAGAREGASGPRAQDGAERAAAARPAARPGRHRRRQRPGRGGDRRGDGGDRAGRPRRGLRRVHGRGLRAGRTGRSWLEVLGADGLARAERDSAFFFTNEMPAIGGWTPFDPPGSPARRCSSRARRARPRPTGSSPGSRSCCRTDASRRSRARTTCSPSPTRARSPNSSHAEEWRPPGSFTRHDRSAHDRAEQRRHHPAAGVRGLPRATGRDGGRGGHGAGRRLPAHRHRPALRERGRGRHGDRGERRPARRGVRHHQALERRPGLRRHARAPSTRAWSGSGSTTSTSTSSTGRCRRWTATSRRGARWRRSRADGRARAIGVSNFQIAHLQRLIDETGTVPAVNQVELHPHLTQARAAGVPRRSTGSSPRPGARWRAAATCSPTRGSPRSREAHGKTPAQVILRWHLQVGTVVIPKSVTPSRIAENLDVFGFTLADDEIAAIEGLDAGQPRRPGPRPLQPDLTVRTRRRSRRPAGCPRAGWGRSWAPGCRSRRPWCAPTPRAPRRRAGWPRGPAWAGS